MNLFLTLIPVDIKLPLEGYVPLDVRIFECKITQKESEIAIATMLTDCSFDQLIQQIRLNNDGDRIYPGQKGPDVKQFAFFCKDDQGSTIIFKGYLSVLPKMCDDGLFEWEFNAEPWQSSKQVQILVDQLLKESAKSSKSDSAKASGVYFEPAFYDDCRLSNLLENRQEVMCWDRVTGQLSLSNIFKGRFAKIAGPDVLEKSISVHMGVTPVNAVNVVVEAKWNQRYEDVISIGKHIENAFPYQTIHTLTPKSLIKCWPKVGDRFGSFMNTRKVYEIVKSQLTPITEAQIPNNKKFTRPFYFSSDFDKRCGEINAQRDSIHKKYSLKYSWFHANMLMHVRYQQPCQERVSFNVVCEKQMVGGVERTLVFRINNANCYLEKPSDHSLFTKQRGEQFLNYARSVAKAHILGTARQCEIFFCVPLKNYMDINLDTSIEITHPYVPNGTIVGKVVGYTLLMSGKGWLAFIKLAATHNGVMEKQVEECVKWNLVPVDNSDAALSLRPYDDQFFNSDNLVESVEIQGDGSSQELILQEMHAQMGMCPKDALNQCPFGITIKLKNLATRPLALMEWQNASDIVYEK